MGEHSAIEWTDHTFNGWIGCTNVSPACDHCYAESLAKRYGWAEWGPGKARKRTSVENWRKPLKWNRDALRTGTRPRVFSNSLSDWADPEVPDDWRRDLFGVVHETPNLDWLLLTKRHALAMGYLEEHAQGLTNIRIGMTVEDEKMASVRLPKLRGIREAGIPTFVSYEPALGPVDWPRYIGAVGWLIAGAESGPKARPAHPDWFRAARDVCAANAIPFHFKQWGEWAPYTVVAGGDLGGLTRAGRVQIVHPGGEDIVTVANMTGGRSTLPGSRYMERVGKKSGGATLDGREHREFPR